MPQPTIHPDILLRYNQLTKDLKTLKNAVVQALTHLHTEVRQHLDSCNRAIQQMQGILKHSLN